MTATAEPIAQVGRRQAGLALGLICSAQFVLQLDFSIVNVALPSIQRELGLVASELQWLVTGYAVTFGSLLLVGGRAADLLGRRRLLVSGLTLFALASLTAGLAQSSLMLVLARMVQGAGGAMVSPAALSLLTTMSPEGPARNRALGIWQASTAAGATTGIIAGGLLTQAFGWRAIFLVNPVLIAGMLLLVPRLLPASLPQARRRIDAPGAILATGALAAFIFGLSNGQQHGFTAPLSLIALVCAVALAVAFVHTERTVREPMVPLQIFSTATRRAAVEAMVLIGAILAGYVYFVSLFLQRVKDFTPIATGLALVPSTVTVILTSTFLTRRLLARIGVKRMLLAGLVSMAAGQLWLAQISASASYAAAVLPGQLLTALGIGLALPTASVAITSGVDKNDQGLAGALFVTGQQTGAAIGLAVLAAVAAARTSHAHGSLAAGYRLSFLISTGIVLAAIALVATQLNSHQCQTELSRQQRETESTNALSEAEAPLRKS